MKKTIRIAIQYKFLIQTFIYNKSFYTVWTRPIHMYIFRDITYCGLSNNGYDGIF